MSPEWGRLFERAGSDVSRYKLSRLFRWCTLEKIAPDELSDEHIDKFEVMLVGEILAGEKADDIYEQLANRQINTWEAAKLLVEILED
jgi:ribosome biogenesis SPOUT family RNA methylase Rps3